MTANMKRKDYTRPVAEVIKPNCNGDILDGVQFAYSPLYKATDGGRANSLSTFGNEEETTDDSSSKNIWEDN